MSVLVDVEIRELSRLRGLIEPLDESSLQGASYDMRLGKQFVRHGAVGTLTNDAPTLVIPPGEFLLLTTMEFLRLPVNLVGHNGIMSNWAKRGLVSLFSPQIDPGFHGVLVVPVFNAGDVAIPIQLGEKIFTVEFVRTRKSASYGWSDRNGEQRGISNIYIPMATRPNMSDISQMMAKVESLEGKLAQAMGRLDLFEATLKGEIREGSANLWGEINVIKARIEALLSRRSTKYTLWGLVIAAITLALTAIALIVTFWGQEGSGRKSPTPQEVMQPKEIRKSEPPRITSPRTEPTSAAPRRPNASNSK